MASYWYCVKHHRVEQGEGICPPIDRLGPFPTEAEAEKALQKAQERNEAWDNDPNWEDEPDWAGQSKRRTPPASE